ncbi:MAG: DUF805 domain-containing protein [Kiritimatiellae bacterium]|nr:DUF805 domain-containing protein [Kiritimatiellia bacterium]
MKYWLQCWKKYAVFSGRARRKEYWMFFLFNAVIGWLACLIICVAGVGLFAALGAIDMNTVNHEQIGFIVGRLFAIASILPCLGVTCRRLHDTGRSAWWLLLLFLPFAGLLVLFVFMCLGSQPGVNAYGPNPKELQDRHSLGNR